MLLLFSGTSYDFADMTKEDIDVVRTVMSVVDKASHDQDPDVEDVRRCVSQLLQKVVKFCGTHELGAIMIESLLVCFSTLQK